MVLLIGMVTGCGGPTVRVGSDLDHAPFIDVDASGDPIGRDIELMEALAEQVDLTVEWVQLPFDQLLPSLKLGEIDVVCATLGITEERAARFDFAAPNYTTSIRAVVRSGASEPRRLADLRGLKVAASKGTTSEEAVRERVPEAILILRSEAEMTPLERLTSRAVDACIMDGPDAETLVESSEGALTLIQEPLAQEVYALVLRKGSERLRYELDRAMYVLRERGFVDALDRRYGLVSE